MSKSASGSGRQSYGKAAFTTIPGADPDAMRPAQLADLRTGVLLRRQGPGGAAAIWPWLLQMGQGRGGFYTQEWVENFLGAEIRNADRIVPSLQSLAIGDQVGECPI